MSETHAADWYALHGKMPRLYVPAAFVAGRELALPDGPARHITRVLRMGEGAPLVLFDGQGIEAGVRLADVSRKQTLVRVEAVWSGSGESPLSVHLGQAISKGDRMDYAAKIKSSPTGRQWLLAPASRVAVRWCPKCIHRCRYQHGLKSARSRCA